MPYALIQKELTVPDVEQLKRACHALPTLTDLDAQTMFNDAYGILIRGQEMEQAGALQNALQVEGVETLVVEETELPVIPPAKMIRQVEFLQTHLTLYDPMKRAFNLPWCDVMLIAAGNVRLQELRKMKTQDEPQYHGSGISYDTIGSMRKKEETHFHLMLEIVLTGGVSRYSILADDFVFDHLGPRLRNNVPRNFALLVQDLAQSAPHAGLNRGAFLICENAEELFAYPSKAAFFEELTWMMWRIAQIGQGAGI